MKISKGIHSVALCLGWCALNGAASAQGTPEPANYSQPSAFEASVIRPTARVVWSKMIGRLESEYARATITALILEDTTIAPSIKRGVRVDLAHRIASPVCNWKYLAWDVMCRRANPAVYIEDDELEAVRKGIERGAVEIRPYGYISQYGGRQDSSERGSGLIVCGYEFPGIEASEISALFTQAIAELRAASR